MHPMISLVECAVGDRDGNATFHPMDPQRTVTTWADGNPGASSLFVASGKYEVETYVQGSEEVSYRQTGHIHGPTQPPESGRPGWIYRERN